MNNKFFIFFLVAVLSGLHLSLSAAPLQQEPAIAVMQKQLLALQLANLGYAEKDPILLMAAAKIIKQQPLQVIQLNKQSAPNKGAKNTSKNGKKNLQAYTADNLLNSAEQFSGGKAELVLLIQDIRTTASRGLTDGAKMHKDEVLANGFDYYKLTFEADAIAKVGVVSDDSQQDLDLYVVDALEMDKVVCQDTSATSGSLCEWTPNKEQDYIIKIKNRSASINAYTMILN